MSTYFEHLNLNQVITNISTDFFLPNLYFTQNRIKYVFNLFFNCFHFTWDLGQIRFPLITQKWKYLQEIRWTENTDKLDSRNRTFLIPKREERMFSLTYKMYNMTSTSTVFHTELWCGWDLIHQVEADALCGRLRSNWMKPFVACRNRSQFEQLELA